jgi:hypothetical protein
MSPARIPAFSAGLPGRTPLILAPGSADSPKSGTTPKTGPYPPLCGSAAGCRLGSHVRRGSRGPGRRRDDAGGEGGDELEALRVELVPGIARPMIVAVRAGEEEYHRHPRGVERDVIGRAEGIAPQLRREGESPRGIG